MTTAELDELSGIELIARERVRQLEELGYTPEHDADHQDGDLAFAAAVYAAPIPIYVVKVDHVTAETGAIPTAHARAHGEVAWVEPWPRGWKRKARTVINDTVLYEARIEELVRAGALIAAEIDRLKGFQTEAVDDQ